MATASIPRPGDAALDPLDLGRRVADWQLAHIDDTNFIRESYKSTLEPRQWEMATFWVGLAEFAESTDDDRYAAAVLDRCRRNEWQMGDRPFHANDQLVGRVYAWAAMRGEGDLGPARRYLDHLVDNPPTTSLTFEGRRKYDRWTWCDALFMAPPTMALLAHSVETPWPGPMEVVRPGYLDFMDREYRETVRLLLDQSGLFYRDSRYIGSGAFWGRGNGWVLAALPVIIRALFSDPRRQFYVELLHTMARALARRQRSDGLWSPSLCDPEQGQPKEASGTALILAGLAQSVHDRLLPDDYLPVIERAWAGLVGCVTPEGMVGWVQQVGHEPGDVRPDDAQFFGSGAFLLAAANVRRLAR